MNESKKKIEIVRKVLEENGLAAVRMRSIDWFAWATSGGSNAVLLTTDRGVAEVFISRDHALILTDAIEAERLREEEVPSPYTIWEGAWADPGAREALTRELTSGASVASDRPQGDERALPPALQKARLCLFPEEIERYRKLGRDAAEAMTETLREARPNWTGFELAARGAQALWKRGIHPALTLVGEGRRMPLYRHATASAEKLGDRAMLVFCARRHGLYANLTRFVYFRKPSEADEKIKKDVALVEAATWNATRPGQTLGQVFKACADAYKSLGYAEEILKHHQGGTTGYLAREEVALPASATRIETNMAFAWNPSITGTKIEDTVLGNDSSVEILTLDPEWPQFSCEGQRRPDYLILA